MSLLVDIPKQGYRTTNNENTAQKFFREYALSSSIKLNKGFLKHLYTILTVVLLFRVISFYVISLLYNQHRSTCRILKDYC